MIDVKTVDFIAGLLSQRSIYADDLNTMNTLGSGWQFGIQLYKIGKPAVWVQSTFWPTLMSTSMQTAIKNDLTARIASLNTQLASLGVTGL